MARDVRIELIVVDNGSTDGTARLVKAFARLAGFPVIVVSEPRIGLSNARNTGVKHASGEILAFTDDDCRLQADFFAMLARVFARQDAPAILGGRVLHGDPTDAPFSIKTDEQAARLDARTHPGGFLLGCNMAIHRKVFETVGLFDPLFGAGAPFSASEETDFIYRAYRAGFAVEYQPDPTVSHFHGRKTAEEIRRLSHGYFVGTGAMYAKHRMGGAWLLRHLLSNIRSAAAELLGGKMFSPDLSISHVDLVRDNLVGMMLYWSHRLGLWAPRRGG